MYWNYRPLGCAIIVGAHDTSGFSLHMIRPSGECFVIITKSPFMLLGLLFMYIRKRKINS